MFGTSFAPAATAANAGKTISCSGWKVTTRKFPISNSAEITAMNAALGIATPEMIFGNNSIEVVHEATGWSIKFNAFDALDMVDKTGDKMLQVAYSDSWQSMRKELHHEIKEVVKPYDWSFTTAYKGTIVGNGEDNSHFTPTESRFTRTDDLIPFDRLRGPEPNLMFDEVMLYEDELADNGIALLSVKVRVMAKRMLVLQRFFLRLDDVLFRIRDTRVYIEYATGEVIREYQAREDSYISVRKGLYMHSPEEIPSLMRDSNYISELLPVVETEREKVVVK